MKVIRIFGKLLISVGFGVLLFVVWTLWGTGIATQRAQASLAKEYAQLPEFDTVENQQGKVVPGPPREFKPKPGDPVFRMSLPTIGRNGFTVVEGVGTDQLASGPGHYPECRIGFPKPLCTEGDEIWPGQVGRTIISGHRTTHDHPFYDLDKMRRGDKILFETKWGDFTYLVTRTTIVPENSLEIADPESDKPELALTTCNPKFSAAERLVVFAELAAEDKL
jgi:sortase A